MSVRAVALIQVAFDSERSLASMESYLAVAGDLGADLAVFPETHPFWRDVRCAPSLSEAKTALASMRCPSGLTFIAGGYVACNRGVWSSGVWNAAFLVRGREVSYPYLKRIPWCGSGTKESDGLYAFGAHSGDIETFKWPGGSCLPLISSDLYGAKESEHELQLKWVEDRYRRSLSEDRPDLIVVPSNANYLSGGRWPARLQACASTLNLPVAFVNFAGRNEHLFGGGGSAVYFPDGTTRPATPSTEPGVYIVDLTPERRVSR